jgi:hypothetical protein
LKSNQKRAWSEKVANQKKAVGWCSEWEVIIWLTTAKIMKFSERGYPRPRRIPFSHFVRFRAQGTGKVHMLTYVLGSANYMHTELWSKTITHSGAPRKLTAKDRDRLYEAI